MLGWEEPPHPYFGARESKENWNFCRKSSIGRYTGVQHCSAGPAQSRQKYPKIGQISGFLIFLDKIRVGGPPPPYFGAVETKRIGHFSRKTPFCRLFEFWEKTAAKIIGEGNLVEVLGRVVRKGSPSELMVESSPSRQRRPPCKTSKEMSDEAADTAALTYLPTR